MFLVIQGLINRILSLLWRLKSVTMDQQICHGNGKIHGMGHKNRYIDNKIDLSERLKEHIFCSVRGKESHVSLEGDGTTMTRSFLSIVTKMTTQKKALKKP